MEYGACSRFWYGGCGGNENRFKDKAECDGTCVAPDAKDRCKLRKVEGPCGGYYPSWYYDKDRNHCAQFIWGGCLGNNNRFESSKECEDMCLKGSSGSEQQMNAYKLATYISFSQTYVNNQKKKVHATVHMTGGITMKNQEDVIGLDTADAKETVTISERKPNVCRRVKSQAN